MNISIDEGIWNKTKRDADSWRKFVSGVDNQVIKSGYPISVEMMESLHEILRAVENRDAT